MGLHIGMSVKNLMSMRKQLLHEYKFNPFLICAFALQLNPTYISSLHLFTDKVVKDKWDNLRDYFNTLKKTYKETNPEPRSGAGAPEPVSKPTWKYWDHMQFYSLPFLRYNARGYEMSSIRGGRKCRVENLV